LPTIPHETDELHKRPPELPLVLVRRGLRGPQPPKTAFSTKRKRAVSCPHHFHWVTEILSSVIDEGLIALHPEPKRPVCSARVFGSAAFLNESKPRDQLRSMIPPAQ